MTTHFLPAERASKEAVSASRQTFASATEINLVLNSIPEVAAIINEQRQLVYGNEALLNLLGFDSVEELGELRIGEALHCKNAFKHEGGCGTSEDCRYCGAALAMQQTMLLKKKIQNECRIIVETTSGAVSLDLKVTASPLFYKDVQYYMITVDDISDEKRRKMLEKIFFHDVINLAGGLKGLMEIIKADTVGESKVSEYVIMAEKVSHELLDEIMSQRSLLAAENGDLNMNLANVNSGRVLKDMLSFFEYSSFKQNVEISICRESVDVCFITDETLLKRIIINMSKNAIEASKPGQTVSLGCNISDKKIIFQVHNQGCIPKSAQFQIFQRSFSTKGNGRGLGTYSIKLLADRYLNATVGFTSCEEAGTTFFVALPLNGNPI